MSSSSAPRSGSSARTAFAVYYTQLIASGQFRSRELVRRMSQAGAAFGAAGWQTGGGSAGQFRGFGPRALAGSPAALRSRSRNSFSGRTLRGRGRDTIHRGRLVHQVEAAATAAGWPRSRSESACGRLGNNRAPCRRPSLAIATRLAARLRLLQHVLQRKSQYKHAENDRVQRSGNSVSTAIRVHRSASCCCAHPRASTSMTHSS
jgi:hypothetical protein